MTDPTLYIRGKMEERGYTPDVSFLQDGFQRWAEADKPGLSGEMLSGGAKMPRRRRATLKLPKVLSAEVEARRGLGMGCGCGGAGESREMSMAMEPKQMGVQPSNPRAQFEKVEKSPPSVHSEGPPPGSLTDALESGLQQADNTAMPSKEEQAARMKEIKKLERRKMVLERLAEAPGKRGEKAKMELADVEKRLGELRSGAGLFSALGKLGKSAAKGLKKAAVAVKKGVKKVATKENLEKLKKAAKKGAEMYVEAEKAGVFSGTREERMAKGRQLAAKKFRKHYMPEEEEEEEEVEMEEGDLEGEGFADLLKKGMELGKKAIATGKKYATKENLEKAKKYAATAKKAYATAQELGLTKGSTKEKLARAKALAVEEGKKRAKKALKDFDHDGVPDSRDKDDDNDGIPDKEDSNDKGAGKPRRKRAPSKRNMAVAKVMRERGVSLGEASRIVKEEGLA